LQVQESGKYIRGLIQSKRSDAIKYVENLRKEAAARAFQLNAKMIREWMKQKNKLQKLAKGPGCAKKKK
jgi:hypothetical protein